MRLGFVLEEPSSVRSFERHLNVDTWPFQENDWAVLAAAAFPEETIAYLHDVLRDPRKPCGSKRLAISYLGVLARSGNEEVKEIYVETIERRGEEPVAEWAAGYLGCYYHGDDVRALLYARAVEGCTEAVRRLDYYPDVDVGALKPPNASYVDSLNRLRARVEILRRPDARQVLGDILSGKSAPRYADRGWAVECAGRWKYADLAPRIREYLPTVRKNNVLLPRNLEDYSWSDWRGQSGNPAFLHAVRALDQITDLTGLEEQFRDYNLMSSGSKSLSRAVELRDRERLDPELLRFLRKSGSYNPGDE